MLHVHAEPCIFGIPSRPPYARIESIFWRAHVTGREKVEGALHNKAGKNI
eukprot:jgi/Antlo1/1396/1239